MGFPAGSDCKESAYNAGDLGSILGLGRSPGEGKDYPLQYSGQENSMAYIVHGVAKSRDTTERLSLSYIYIYILHIYIYLHIYATKHTYMYTFTYICI